MALEKEHRPSMLNFLVERVGKAMIVAMIWEQMSEGQKDVEDLVSSRLSDLDNWRIEESTILSRWKRNWRR